MKIRGVTGETRRGVRAVRFAALAVPAMLLLTSCSLLNGSSDSGSSNSSGSGLEKTTLNVGFLPTMGSVPFEIALQKGYFKQEGLNVKGIPIVNGTASITKLLAGGLDIGYSDTGTLLEAQSKGTGDFRIVAPGSEGAARYASVITLPNSGVNGVKDLQGKTVAENAPDDLQALALKANLQANDIDVSSIKFTQVPFATVPQALATHQVDTAISLEPYTTQAALASGARTVFDLYGSGPTAQLPLACFFATQKFVQQDPKTMAAFAKAVAKGAADAQDRATVEKILPTFTKVDADTAHLIALPGYPATLDAKDFQRVADLMKTYGLLTSPLNVSPMILPTPSISGGS